MVVFPSSRVLSCGPRSLSAQTRIVFGAACALGTSAAEIAKADAAIMPTIPLRFMYFLHLNVARGMRTSN